MRDRGIVLDPYLDHGVLVRVCQEVGVPVEELDPSSAGAAQVSPCDPEHATFREGNNDIEGKGCSPVQTVGCSHTAVAYHPMLWAELTQKVLKSDGERVEFLPSLWKLVKTACNKVFRCDTCVSTNPQDGCTRC